MANNNTNNSTNHRQPQGSPSFINFQSESITPQQIAIRWNQRRIPQRPTPRRATPRYTNRRNTNTNRYQRNQRNQLPHPGAARTLFSSRARNIPTSRPSNRNQPNPGEPFPENWRIWGSDNPWANENNKVAQVKVEALTESVDHLSAKVEDLSSLVAQQTLVIRSLAKKTKVQQKELREVQRTASTTLERSSEAIECLASFNKTLQEFFTEEGEAEAKETSSKPPPEAKQVNLPTEVQVKVEQQQE